MTQSPMTHAGDALAVLSAKLNAARSEESRFADRLAALETELSLNVARLESLNVADKASASPATIHRAHRLNQRIADLLELRAGLIAERARRRRMIDEMAQRKEAIGAALAVLREKTASQRVAAG